MSLTPSRATPRRRAASTSIGSSIASASRSDTESPPGVPCGVASGNRSSRPSSRLCVVSGTPLLWCRGDGQGGRVR